MYRSKKLFRKKYPTIKNNGKILLLPKRGTKMIHLKRLALGLLIGGVTFGLGYGLADVAMSLTEFGWINALQFLLGGVVIFILAYLIGWIVVDK
jgi:hypothetical protein